MSTLKPDVRKRMLITGYVATVFFTILMVYYMSIGAPTAVVALVAMGLVIFAIMSIYAYAWPQMTVDNDPKLRCPRCGAEIREDFVVCPACTMPLKQQSP